MKRILIGSVLVVALVVPVAATAATTDNLFGALDDQPESAVKVKVATDDAGERSVRSFAVKQFSVACGGGETAVMRRAKLTGEIPVGDNRTFKANDDNGETTFKVSGRIGSRKASGSFRFFGRIVDNGVNRQCDSGKQTWEAA